MPLLRRDRICLIGPRQQFVRQEGDLNGRRVPYGFGQQSDHVVKARSRPQTTIPPGRIGRAGTSGRTWFTFSGKAVMHRGSYQIDAEGYEWIVIVVERI